MRILSQEKLGIIDLPYESIGISIMDKTSIIAYPAAGSLDDGFWQLAIYSTEVKARKAMEMLHEAYSPVLVIKEHQEGLKPNIKPNDWLLTPALPTQRIEVDDNFYFQFPQDSEMEE